jgi:prepilin-type N-terminal cleavage/methylation domain-containing protein
VSTSGLRFAYGRGVAVKKGGYSLVELILVLAIMGAITVIAVPRLQFGAVDRKQAEATVELLVSGLRRTRSLALQEAVSAPRGMTLTLGGARPHRYYEIKNAQTGFVMDRHELEEPIHVAGLDGTSFRFGPYGNLQEGSATQLRVTHGSWSTLITVTTATGAVTITPGSLH